MVGDDEVVEEPVAEAAPVQEPAAPAVAEVEPSASEAPQPVVSQADAFAAKAKQAVRDAISAQPFRGMPEFDDLKAVADAIIDALADEMRG